MNNFLNEKERMEIHLFAIKINKVFKLKTNENFFLFTEAPLIQRR